MILKKLKINHKVNLLLLFLFLMVYILRIFTEHSVLYLCRFKINYPHAISNPLFLWIKNRDSLNKEDICYDVEMSIIDLLNSDRINGEKVFLTKPVKSVTFDKELYKISKILAENLSEKYSYTLPDGKSYEIILKDKGYKFSKVCEIIGISTIEPPNAQAIYEKWLNTKMDRAAMFSELYTNIAVSLHIDKDTGLIYAVMLLSKK